MKSQPLVIRRPIPPVETHELSLSAMPILQAQLDAEDRLIEVYALLAILAVEVVIYWVMR